MNNIKNWNLHHNFLELCVISVKSEQIGQIGANLVKISQKGHFCKIILNISNLCIYTAIRMIRLEEIVTLKNHENVHRYFTVPDT
jgi:hypothetical protein